MTRFPRRVLHVYCPECGSFDHENAFVWQHCVDRRCARPKKTLFMSSAGVIERKTCGAPLYLALCPSDPTNSDIVPPDDGILVKLDTGVSFPLFLDNRSERA